MHFVSCQLNKALTSHDNFTNFVQILLHSFKGLRQYQRNTETLTTQVAEINATVLSILHIVQ